MLSFRKSNGGMSEPDISITPEIETAPSISFIGSVAAREFVRYFIASLIALVIDIGSLALLTSYFNVPYLVSGAAAFLFGLAIVYMLSVTWVFESRAVRDPKLEFVLFLGIGVVGLGINEAALAILTGILSMHYLLSKAASVALVFSWNFFARKWLLFSR